MARFVLIFLLFFAATAFSLPTHAAGQTGCTYSSMSAQCDTQIHASTAFTSSDFDQAYYSQFCNVHPKPAKNKGQVLDTDGKRYVWKRSCADDFPEGGDNWATANYVTPCPVGTKPDPIKGQCVDPDERCLALNSGISTQGPVPRTWTSMCLASGCQAVLDSPTTTTAQGHTIYRGTLRYTGACGVEPPPGTPDWDGNNDDNKPRPECVPVTGQTMCVKPNGDHCYSASTGRTICWGQGETGEKTDGPTIEIRKPGTDPPGDPIPDSGDDVTPQNPPVTTTTTTGGGTVIITTTGTWTTTNGTDGGNFNDGESTDSGGAPGGSGDDDGDDPTATGGENCSSPPVCANDAVGCAILYQQFKNRCNTEGGGHGDAVNAAQAAEDELPAEGSDTSARVTDDDGSELTGVLGSASGWASRGQCPIDVEFNLSFGRYVMPKDNLCSVMDALASLVLLAGYVAAGMILLGGQKAV